MLNKQLLIGHLGEDPEVGQTPDGNTYTRFRIATTERSFTTARGQVVPERTTWHNIETWGNLARSVRDNLHKGSKVYIEGIHHTRDYQDKDGKMQTWHSCDATYIEFLTPKPTDPKPTEPKPTGPKPTGTK